MCMFCVHVVCVHILRCVVCESVHVWCVHALSAWVGECFVCGHHVQSACVFVCACVVNVCGRCACVVYTCVCTSVGVCMCVHVCTCVVYTWVCECVVNVCCGGWYSIQMMTSSPNFACSCCSLAHDVDVITSISVLCLQVG